MKNSFFSVQQMLESYYSNVSLIDQETFSRLSRHAGPNVLKVCKWKRRSVLESQTGVPGDSQRAEYSQS